METGKTIKLAVFCLIFIATNKNGLAQTAVPRKKYWTYGANFGCFGISPNTKSSRVGDVFMPMVGIIADNNGRGGSTITGKKTLGIHAGYMWGYKHNRSLTSLQLDFQQNRNSTDFEVPFKEKMPLRSGDNDADDPLTGDSAYTYTKGTWVETDLYLKYSVSLQQMWPADKEFDDRYWYIKLSFGKTFLHRNQHQVVSVGQQEQGTDKWGNVITAKTVAANPQTFMLGTEIGMRYFNIPKDRSLDIGISCQIPFASSYTREYEFIDQIPASSPKSSPTYSTIGKERITFSGMSVLLNLTYNFNSEIKPKPRDTTNLYEKLENSKPAIAHIPKPHHLNGRRVNIDQKVTVKDTVILLDVWDRGKIDGDRISLYLNGEKILDDYTVVKAKKQIVLHLKPGKNYLVMHALNLGRIPPNTAAIEVVDDVTSKQITLNSNLRRSGGLELVCKPRDH